MNRINLFRTEKVFSTPSRTTPAALDSVAWGKSNFDKTASTLVFAAVLIVCSIGVGCTSDKPVSTNNQPVMTQPTPPAVTTPASMPAPELQAAAKPVHKKVVHRAPVNATYADKTSGVSFQYPRRYLLKTGDAAGEMVSSDPAPMNFVQPGGVVVAAVTIPETAYPKSDLASAFFDLSVNKTLTAEQCGQFTESKLVEPPEAAAAATAQSSKLMIGDMELQSAETLASDGSRQEAGKYFHGFANGACYEFVLKVATGVETDEGGKRVDREEVFKRLEKILATVKINPVAAPEVTASAPVTSTASAPATPAQ
jgi:hypothetical protein